MKMEKKLDALTVENDRLRGENDYLKNQETQLAQTLQRQKDEMKKLEKEFVQLKGQLHKQNTVLEVLPKLLVSVSPFSSFSICFTKLLANYKQQQIDKK